MIYYTIQPSIFSLHTVVASTKQGICAVLFDYKEKEAATELRKMFPGKDLEFESVRNLNYAYKFVDALEDNLPLGSLDVDIICGTSLQKVVWDELRKIPKGTTTTYSELAERVGKPKAIRAVASAVARNPVSIIIPCHRVLPKSGGIGKYRWGSEMKRELLEREISNLCI